MNDYEALAELVKPLEHSGHPIVSTHVKQYRQQVADDHAASHVHLILDLLEIPSLSSGEFALLRVAIAVFRWGPIDFNDLGAFDTVIRHHVIAVLADRLACTNRFVSLGALRLGYRAVNYQAPVVEQEATIT